MEQVMESKPSLSALVDRLRASTLRARLLVAAAVLVLAGSGVAFAAHRGARVHDDRIATFAPALRSPGAGTVGAVRGPLPPVAATGGAESLDAAGVPAASGTGGNVGSAAKDLGTMIGDGSKIVHSANLAIEVARRRAGAALERIEAITRAHGGFVVSASHASGSAASASAQVRVPADQFDAVRAAIGALGKVTGEEVHGEDVSGQIVDLDARLRSLQVEEDTLRALVGQAKSVSDVLQVQPQLFDVRRQIEQLQAQRKDLDNKTSFAAIGVVVTELGAAGIGPKPVPVLERSVRTAGHAALAVVGGMLVVLAVALPLALVAGVVVAATSWRRSRGRRVAPAAA